MKIEFTVEDYFNELRVMENYYGQEEELYPWMYMLLQMIEFRKKSIEEDYNRLCIIDVHKHIGSNSDSKLKKIIKKRVPDFVIIDPKSDSLCGCVEIKKTTPNKSLKLQVGSFYIDTIKYNFEITSTSKDKTHEIPYDLSSEEDKNSIVARIKYLNAKFPILTHSIFQHPIGVRLETRILKKFSKNFVMLTLLLAWILRPYLINATPILKRYISPAKTKKK